MGPDFCMGGDRRAEGLTMNILPPYTFDQVMVAIVLLLLGALLYRSYNSDEWDWLQNIAFAPLIPFWWLYKNGVAVAINILFVALFFALPVGLVMLLRFVGFIV